MGDRTRAALFLVQGDTVPAPPGWKHMRFSRDWVVALCLVVACGDGSSGVECSETSPCGAATVCRAGVCMDYAQVRLSVTADTEGASSQAGVFVYDLSTGASCQAGTCGGFAWGTPIKLRANPIGGHRFIGWSGDDACSGSDLELVIEKLTDDLYCVANYLRRTRVSGTVGGAPDARASGVVASSDSPSASCQDASCEVDLGAQVRLSAPTRWGARFARWTGPGCGEATTTETVVTAQDNDLVCTASYVGRYTVSGRATLSKAVIKVSSFTSGAACETSSCVLDGGGSALLEAPEVEGYRFSGWSGTSGCVGGNPVLRIDPVTGPQRCLAAYAPRVRVRGKSSGAMPTPVVTALSYDALATCDAGGGSGFCDIDVGGSALLIAQSAAGFRLSGWSGEMCEEKVSSGITLENVLRDAECTAEYRRGIAVSGVVLGAEGFVTVTSATPGAQCARDRCILDEGGDATLAAPTMQGMRFLGWSGDALCVGTDPTLRLAGVMTSVTCVARYAPRYEVFGESAPDDAGDVMASSPTADASCEDGGCWLPEGGEVTLEARPHAGFRFAGWSGGPACASYASVLRIADVRGNLRCQANFVATISVMGHARPESAGMVQVFSDLGASSCNGAVCSVDRGAVVGAAATPFDGYDFAGWSDCSSSREAVITLPDIMQDTVCTANFAPRRFTVTSTVAPVSSGSVTASSASDGASCTGGSCSVTFGSAVRLVASASPGFAFSNWTGCGGSSAPDITLDAVRGNQSCVANFTRTALTATVQAGLGGVVEVVAYADGADCAGQSCSFPFGGGAVTVRATPANGFVFNAWSDCSNSTDPTLVLTGLTQNVNCVANFGAQRASVTGMVAPSSPAGSGSITASSRNPSASCSGAACTLDVGGTVQLVAAPASGFRFVGWTGCTTSGAATLDLPDVSGSVTCVATFERARFRVRGSAMPSAGGTVAASSSAPNAACTGSECTLDPSDSVTLTAMPASGFGFAGWSGDDCPSGNGAVNTFMVRRSVECVATFTTLPPVLVGLVAGTGGKVVVTMPADCSPPSCMVPHGATLEATANADSGYDVVGWTGTGCTSSGPTLTLTSVTSPLSCSASFARRFTISAVVPPAQSAFGTVEVGTSAGACPNNSCTVPAGTSVYVTPREAAGSRFTGWVEPECNMKLGANGGIVNVSEDLACTAVFNGSTAGVDAGVPAASVARPSAAPTASGALPIGPASTAVTAAPVAGATDTPVPPLGVFPPAQSPLNLPLLNVPAQDAGLPPF